MTAEGWGEKEIWGWSTVKNKGRGRGVGEDFFLKPSTAPLPPPPLSPNQT